MGNIDYFHRKSSLYKKIHHFFPDMVPFPFMELPEKVQNAIFLYLTPAEQKRCTLVSKAWLNILTQSEFAQNFALTFKDVLIYRLSPPYNIFTHTSRPFPSVEIFDLHIRQNVDRDLEFFKKIGAKTEFLTLTNFAKDEDVVLNPVLSATLSCFPLVKVLKTTVKQLTFLEIPDCIERIELIDCLDKLDEELKAKLESLEGRENLKIHPHLVTTEFLKETLDSDKELIDLITPMSNVLVKPINILTKKTISLDNILSIFAPPDKPFLIDQEAQTKFFSYLPKLKNLSRLHTKTFNGCFFMHEKIEHAKLENFRYTHEQPDEPICEICKDFALKSFPNLKIVTDGLTPLYLSPKPKVITCNLEWIKSCAVNLETLEFLAMFEPGELTTETLAKLPMMKNLHDVAVTPSEVAIPTVEALKVLVSLTPNVTDATLDFELTVEMVIILLDSWVHLKNLTISEVNLENYQAREFVKIVTTYAKELREFDFNFKRNGEKIVPSCFHIIDLFRGISTLRKSNNHSYFNFCGTYYR